GVYSFGMLVSNLLPLAIAYALHAHGRWPERHGGAGGIGRRSSTVTSQATAACAPAAGQGGWRRLVGLAAAGRFVVGVLLVAAVLNLLQAAVFPGTKLFFGLSEHDQLRP